MIRTAVMNVKMPILLEQLIYNLLLDSNVQKIKLSTVI